MDYRKDAWKKKQYMNLLITFLFLFAVCSPGWVFAEENEQVLEWEGQGSENAFVGEDCTVGFWHWVLTPGGNQVITGALLTVTYSNDETSETEGYSPGAQDRGAWHFDVTFEDNEVVSASVEFTYEGDGKGKTILTISNSHCVEKDDNDENDNDENDNDENDNDENDNDELPPTGGLPYLGAGLGAILVGLLLQKRRL